MIDELINRKHNYDQILIDLIIKQQQKGYTFTVKGLNFSIDIFINTVKLAINFDVHLPEPSQTNVSMNFGKLVDDEWLFYPIPADTYFFRLVIDEILTKYNPTHQESPNYFPYKLPTKSLFDFNEKHIDDKDFIILSALLKEPIIQTIHESKKKKIIMETL